MQKLKIKPNKYEITISLRSDPNKWSSHAVNEDQLLLELATIMSNDKVQIEAVALVATSRSNRNDLPTE